LNEKVKEKELKKSLQAIFEQFGKVPHPILDISVDHSSAIYHATLFRSCR
jgi:hypothetical protein